TGIDDSQRAHQQDVELWFRRSRLKRESAESSGWSKRSTAFDNDGRRHGWWPRTWWARRRCAGSRWFWWSGWSRRVWRRRRWQWSLQPDVLAELPESVESHES